jgi:hypothetical protein
MRGNARRKCPEDGRLLASFLGEIGPGDAERIRTHVSSCLPCERKMKVLSEIAADLKVRGQDLPDVLARGEEEALRKQAHDEIRRIRRSRGRRRLVRSLPAWGAAASLFIMMAAAGGLFLSRTGSEDADRGPANRIRLIEPAGTIESAPFSFRWARVKNGDIYVLEVFDEELRLVLSRSTKDDSISLAPGDRQALEPGRAYYWDVEAHDDENRVIGSGQGSFAIAPGAAVKPRPK